MCYPGVSFYSRSKSSARSTHCCSRVRFHCNTTATSKRQLCTPTSDRLGVFLRGHDTYPFVTHIYMKSVGFGGTTQHFGMLVDLFSCFFVVPWLGGSARRCFISCMGLSGCMMKFLGQVESSDSAVCVGFLGHTIYTYIYNIIMGKLEPDLLR